MNQYGIFEFASKSKFTHYDEDEFVQSYAGDAFGYRLIRRSDGRLFVGVGQPEGLYRCICQMALSAAIGAKLIDNERVHVLDMACGLGRTVADLATHLPRALVVGLDYSSVMIRYAAEILTGSGQFRVDLSRYGFGVCHMPKLDLKNVFLAQADARQLPLRTSGCDAFDGFDLVINSMLVDRIATTAGVETALTWSVRLLKRQGTLVFASPFNWISEETWKADRRRDRGLVFLESLGLEIEEAFDGLVYRELMDPYGTHLELPVLVARARRI